MFIITNIFLLLLFAVPKIRCQSLLPVMQTNPNISKFTKLITDLPDLKGYFDNPAMVIFVPSDTAMSDFKSAGINIMNLVKSHMFLSNLPSNPSLVVGTTTNWTQYRKVVTKTSSLFYRMLSIDNLNTFFMYTSGTQFRVNEALLTGPDNVVNGTQVYHIINKVLNNSPVRQFMTSIQLNPSLSRSYEYWQALTAAANTGKLPETSYFKSAFLPFTADFPGTMLVPTNAAWDAVGDMSAYSNITNLVPVMARFYIPGALHFLIGDSVTFQAGFNSAPMTSSEGLITGIITADLQVSVQNFTARIIQSNIPMAYGVIHIIDNAFVTPVTLSSFLSNNNKLFINKMVELNLTAYLNGGYAIMAIDDTTVAKMTGNVTLAILNSIIINNGSLNETKGPYKTLGGLTIKLILMYSKPYLAVQQSAADNTWISVVPVISLNQLVGSTYVSRLNGSLNGYPSPCDLTLQVLNSSLYMNLLTVNNVTIHIGSPYTILAPSNAAVNLYIANQSTLNTNLIKYTMQRMIIPNRLIFNTRTPGSFFAATMNYAATFETINITNTASEANISFNEFSQNLTFSGGGFYCYSNTLTDSTRFNLIYPASFVIVSTLDTQQKACVAPPCVGCQIRFSWLLLIAMCLVMVQRISNPDC